MNGQPHRLVRALTRNDRFATPRMFASILAFLLVAISYGQASVAAALLARNA